MSIIPRIAFTAASSFVADAGGVYAKAVLLSIGPNSGIHKGEIAVDERGLVGRITEVGTRTARVLLITDLNSRIPVTLETSRAHAILVGTNGNRPRLQYWPEGVTPQEGERVVTSAEANAFPANLPIGTVHYTSSGAAEVEPDLARCAEHLLGRARAERQRPDGKIVAFARDAVGQRAAQFQPRAQPAERLCGQRQRAVVLDFHRVMARQLEFRAQDGIGVLVSPFALQGTAQQRVPVGDRMIAVQRVGGEMTFDGGRDLCRLRYTCLRLAGEGDGGEQSLREQAGAEGGGS